MSADHAGAAPVAPEPSSLQLHELHARVGQHLGYSDWRTIDQARVNAFADVTDDDQWIHVDEAKAAAGPFGATIVHGYLTLSLAPVMLDEAFRVEDASMVINYGLNRVRYPAPLRVGSTIRLGVELAAAETVFRGVQTTLLATFEVRGETKPCCVAEILYRYYE